MDQTMGAHLSMKQALMDQRADILDCSSQSFQSHLLVKQGLVDIHDAFERLKGGTTLNGHGPVLEKGVIWQAVEESRRRD
jgi:hypothetical protein